MRYTIASTRLLAPSVREFRLVPADGSAAPAWQPGDHVELAFESKAGGRYRNAYSLVGAPGGGLRIAVQLEAGGRGGSLALHDEYEAGMELDLDGPLGGFALHPGAARTVLLAGGIGITPLVSMAHALAVRGQGFELHYLARTPEGAVLLDELGALPTGEITVHSTGDGKRPDLARLIGPRQEGCELHACGPAGLLEVVRGCAAALGWRLTPQQRSQGMTTCVSWAAGSELELDL